MITGEKLRALVGRYLIEKGCEGEEWTEFLRKLPVSQAIEKAALAIGPGDKKHHLQPSCRSRSRPPQVRHPPPQCRRRTLHRYS